jgi:predicted chitinase
VPLNKLTGKDGKWFEGKGTNASYYRTTYDTYTDVIGIDKENFLAVLKQKISEYQINKSCYHIAHFLAQIIHESAHFDTTLEYASGTAYGTQHSSAEKMEHTQDSDGPKYRGRGLIQLTWKKNYRIYGKSKGDELKFVNDPNAIGNNIINAIDASCWYWRKNGTISQLYDAKGDINILIDNDRDNVTLVTKAVNGGSNGLDERKRLYKEIVKAMNLEIGEIK